MTRPSDPDTVGGGNGVKEDKQFYKSAVNQKGAANMPSAKVVKMRKANKEEGSPAQGQMVIPLESIDASWKNNISRQFLNRDALDASLKEKPFKELKDSIKSDGLFHPLTIAQDGRGYRLVAGFRRYEAIKELQEEDRKLSRPSGKWDTVKVQLIGGTPLTQDLLNVKENIIRNDISPFQLACAAFDIREKHGLKIEEIASHLGKGPTYIANLIRAREKLAPSILEAWARAGQRDQEGQSLATQDVQRATRTDRLNEYVMLKDHKAQQKAFSLNCLVNKGMSEEEARKQLDMEPDEAEPKGKGKKGKAKSVSGKALIQMREDLAEVAFDEDDDERYAYRDGALALLDFLLRKNANVRVGKVVIFDPRAKAKEEKEEKE